MQVLSYLLPGKMEMTDDPQFDQGLEMRKRVMGEAFVEKAFANVDAFTAPLQEFVTRNAWGTTWCRDVLDLKTRSLITLSMLTAMGRSHEIKGHVRGAINNGASTSEIQETLLHAAIYCGMPLAIDAFRSAHETLRELGCISGEEGISQKDDLPKTDSCTRK